MGNILLDYAFPVSLITPLPSASTGFIRRVCVVAKPKAGQEGNVGNLYPCNNMVEVAARTDNESCVELFKRLSQVFILLADDLDLAAYMEAEKGKFWTVLIARGEGGFTDEEVGEGIITPATSAEVKIQDILYRAVPGAAGDATTIIYTDTMSKDDGSATVSVAGQAITIDIEDGVTTAETIATAVLGSAPAMELLSHVIVDDGDETDPQDIFSPAEEMSGGADEVPGGEGLKLGTFDGVVGVSSDDGQFCADMAAMQNRVGFFTKAENNGDNMFFSFGSLLGAVSNWSNQQFITLPKDDEVNQLGQANQLFDDRVSFGITDSQYATTLGFFAAGGKAIIAPYVLKNLTIDLQSRALQWISQNQPQYTIVEATRLQNVLQENVIDSYIRRGWLTGGTVQITVENANFVANGNIEVPEPTAMWRVFTQMVATV
jgi:hypothetical protein